MIFQSREVFPFHMGASLVCLVFVYLYKIRERTLKIPRFRTQKDLIGETKFCKSRFIFLSCKQKSIFLLHFFTHYIRFLHFVIKKQTFNVFCKHFCTLFFILKEEKFCTSRNNVTETSHRDTSYPILRIYSIKKRQKSRPCENFATPRKNFATARENFATAREKKSRVC